MRSGMQRWKCISYRDFGQWYTLLGTFSLLASLVHILGKLRWFYVQLESPSPYYVKTWNVGFDNQCENCLLCQISLGMLLLGCKLVVVLLVA